MQLTLTDIADVLLIRPRVFQDCRGYFLESYNREKFLAAGLCYDFVQDNQSYSRRGTIRGLHFQKHPHAQAKLVRVLSGRILDVAVDLRSESSTYGQHVAVELNEENRLQMLIPRGFAHGFSVLSDHAVVAYKCDAPYAPQSEGGISFSDPDLGIDWQIAPSEAILSPNDRALPRLKDLDQCF